MQFLEDLKKKLTMYNESLDSTDDKSVTIRNMGYDTLR
jgi:hypothetical protein